VQIQVHPKKEFDEKLDYFYTAYRKDFVKEHEKCMSFEEGDDKKMIDWGSLSRLIFSEKKKPFKKALEKLNKIKSRRFDRKYHQGTNNKFFDTLMKASRRKMNHKSLKKDTKGN